MPSKERLYYYLISQVGLVVLTSSTVLGHDVEPLSQWSIATDVSLWLFVLFGTIWVYRTNARGDNREFIERIMCLGVPVIIQCLLALALVIMPIVAAIEYNYSAFIYNFVLSEELDGFMFGVFMLLMAYFYFRLNQAIKIASH